jgi:hypothetical protein
MVEIAGSLIAGAIIGFFISLYFHQKAEKATKQQNEELKHELLYYIAELHRRKELKEIKLPETTINTFNQVMGTNLGGSLYLSDIDELNYEKINKMLAEFTEKELPKLLHKSKKT